MSTNYYLYEKPFCPTCERPFERLHIGKSSGGWCFALHIIPERNINTFADWCELWRKSGVRIEDEYGETITPEAMERIVADRLWHGAPPSHCYIDGTRCVAHGDGTYDLIIGEFS